MVANAVPKGVEGSGTLMNAGPAPPRWRPRPSPPRFRAGRPGSGTQKPRTDPSIRGSAHLAVDSTKPTLDRAISLASDPIRAGFGEAHSASDVNEGLGDALTSMY